MSHSRALAPIYEVRQRAEADYREPAPAHPFLPDAALGCASCHGRSGFCGRVSGSATDSIAATREGPKVCRLPAGGRWIRTSGSAREALSRFDPLRFIYVQKDQSDGGARKANGQARPARYAGQSGPRAGRLEPGTRAHQAPRPAWTL